MKFEKISEKTWTDFCKKYYGQMSDDEIVEAYKNIKLPHAGSQFAAGHDFYAPIAVEVDSNNPTLVPTGIRWVTEVTDKDKVLILCPRSGLGTKYGFALRNTVGVIDADYCLSDNEGHILVSVVANQSCKLNVGNRFIQGIILPYFRCGENNTVIRNGGFGSTGEK